ncbi:hypothetical protein Nepgr_011439 [Nepenthes gracilis]|uniref:Uncharacterized protein n=1 Tax=Nepenthes gracilis TaxID=150966 RepID=A0AAD3XLY6_NEPGR|nr:hypothetical protein Nepgr_011439 [Nepenthes gracilis]
MAISFSTEWFLRLRGPAMRCWIKARLWTITSVKSRACRGVRQKVGSDPWLHRAVLVAQGGLVSVIEFSAMSVLPPGDVGPCSESALMTRSPGTSPTP